MRAASPTWRSPDRLNDAELDEAQPARHAVTLENVTGRGAIPLRLTDIPVEAA